jgi:IS30 family transposase
MQQKRLTLSKRYKISFLLEEGYSQSEISRRLCRDRTVIHREVKRNSLNGGYSAEEASHLVSRRSQISHRSIKFKAEF